jgi:hypothetical protein
MSNLTPLQPSRREKALDDVHRLKPPESEQATVDQWLATEDKIKADLEELRDKAKAHDLQGARPQRDGNARRPAREPACHDARNNHLQSGLVPAEAEGSRRIRCPGLLHWRRSLTDADDGRLGSK